MPNPMRKTVCDFCVAEYKAHYSFTKVAPIKGAYQGKGVKCDLCGKRIYSGAVYDMFVKRRSDK